jgi:hypothetical protein
MILRLLVVCLLTVDVDVDTHVRPTKRFGCVEVQLIPIVCSLCFIYRQKFEACAKVSRKLTSLMLLLLSSLNRNQCHSLRCVFVRFELSIHCCRARRKTSIQVAPEFDFDFYWTCTCSSLVVDVKWWNWFSVFALRLHAAALRALRSNKSVKWFHASSK